MDKSVVDIGWQGNTVPVPSLQYLKEYRRLHVLLQKSNKNINSCIVSFLHITNITTHTYSTGIASTTLPGLSIMHISILLKKTIK